MWLLATLVLLPIVQAQLCLHNVARGSSLLQTVHTGELATRRAPMLLRPSEGGSPDTVEFGVLLKGFSGIDFPTLTWSADAVLTLRWRDRRAANAILPEGDASVSLSQEVAEGLIWMPDMVVTNADFLGSEVKSTTVFVNADGTVNKTQRLLLRMRSEYAVDEFPYDKQLLKLELASSAYMSQDVRLKPMKDASMSGAEASLFAATNWKFLNFHLEEATTIDGTLSKSRGFFNVHVARDPSSIQQNVMYPEIFLVALAYTVFLFPVSPAFAMPRVGTSMISFLSMLTVNMQTLQMLPESRPEITWMDGFDVTCRYLVFTVICLNVVVEAAFHILEEQDLAKQMTRELSLIYPFGATLAVGSCWLAYTHNLQTVCWMQRLGIVSAASIYVASAVLRMYFNRKKQ